MFNHSFAIWRTSALEPTEKKKRGVELRDFRPKSDVKGGARNVKDDEKPVSRRTGEIDFMKGVN